MADAALAAGAEVVGVIPERLIQRELGHGGVTELQVVGSMHERKHQMAMHSDAFPSHSRRHRHHGRNF